MKIHTITVTAARTVPDPHQHYGNLRPEITVSAEPDEGEDFRACIQELQAVAEGLLNDHIEHLVIARTAIENNDRLTVAQKRVLDMAKLIREDQSTLRKERAPLLRKARKEGL